jgi:hypothetical protein
MHGRPGNSFVTNHLKGPKMCLLSYRQLLSDLISRTHVTQVLGIEPHSFRIGILNSVQPL